MAYYFSQIHGKLYFFKGELEVFDRAHIWEKEQQLSSRELASFSTTLLEKALACFDERINQEIVCMNFLWSNI